MTNEKNYKKLLEKVERITKTKKLDLSSDEDLSIAIMNLISIEEHLFFTAQKTAKGKYFDLLNEIREIRKNLLKKIIKDYEGEIWCISKHLLASSMRLIEVGAKELKKGNKNEAKNLFDKAYKLYCLFWGINLKEIKLNEIENQSINKKEINCLKENNEKEKQNNNKEKAKTTVWDKLKTIFEKAIDCCKE